MIDEIEILLNRWVEKHAAKRGMTVDEFKAKVPPHKRSDETDKLLLAFLRREFGYVH